MKKTKQGWGGYRPSSGRKTINNIKLDTVISSFISSSLLAEGETSSHIFYSPIMNESAMSNYQRSVVERKSFEGIENQTILNNVINEKIEYGIWGVNDGKSKGMNKAQFEKIKCNDIILFIAKESEYQSIVSIGLIDSTIVNTQISEEVFGDSQYKNIMFIKKLIILKKSFRISKRRKSVAKLKGVPDSIWHNSYDMFRQWNFFERINKNKFSHYKLLSEIEFIELLIKDCDGNILYDVNNESLNYYSEEKDYWHSNESALTLVSEDNSNEIDDDIENINLNELLRSKTTIEKVVDNKSIKTSLRRKPNSNVGNEGKLPMRKSKYIGWLGERLIFEHLENKNIGLLNDLYIDINEKYEVEWFNKDVNICEDWEDKSSGNGCDIIVKSNKRTIYLEVKTSLKQGYLLNLTGNEINKAANFRNNYFLIIIDNISAYRRDGISIKVYEDPIKNIIFKKLLSNTREISMYR